MTTSTMGWGVKSPTSQALVHSPPPLYPCPGTTTALGTLKGNQPWGGPREFFSLKNRVPAAFPPNAHLGPSQGNAKMWTEREARAGPVWTLPGWAPG